MCTVRLESNHNQPTQLKNDAIMCQRYALVSNYHIAHLTTPVLGMLVARCVALGECPVDQNIRLGAAYIEAPSAVASIRRSSWGLVHACTVERPPLLGAERTAQGSGLGAGARRAARPAARL